MRYKALHIILALLLFISSTGVVLHQHYCQNELKSAALFVAAKSCAMDRPTKSCPLHPAMAITKKGCCDDRTEYLQTDEEKLTAPVTVDLTDFPALYCALLVVLQIDLPVADTKSLHYLHYKPPILIRDLPVSLQTFLC